MPPPREPLVCLWPAVVPPLHEDDDAPPATPTVLPQTVTGAVIRALARLLSLDLIKALLLGEQSRGKDDREAVGRELVPGRGIGFRGRDVPRT